MGGWARAAAGLALAGLAAVTGGGAPAAAPGPGGRPLVAAHRGGARLWPENSLLAFRNAVALGVDFVETDVHLTADGEVVVLHDPTLDRTTTGRGPVRDARLADLAALRLRAADGRVTDEPLPTLRALLEQLAPTRVGLLLEIKTGADRRPYPAIEEKVLALLREHRLAGRTLVMAFEAETVRRVHGLDPAVGTVLLVSRRRLERDGVAAAEAVRWTREAGAGHLGLEHTAVDGAVVAAARAAGVRLGAWTVNDG